MKKRIVFDSHGPFVRINGGLYRPQRSTESGSERKEHYTSLKCTDLKLTAGQEVDVKWMTHTPMCLVTTRDGVYDVWYNHGTYWDAVNQKCIKSSLVWEPLCAG